MRWSRLSNVEKFDAYTRWSIYLMVLVLPMVLMTWAPDQRDDRPGLRIAFWISALLLTAACWLAVWQVIGRHRVDKQVHPLALGAVVVTCAISLALALTTWPAPREGARAQVWVMVLCLAYALTSATVAMSVRTTVLLCALATAGLAVMWVQTGYDQAVQGAIGAAILFASAVGAVRASVSMLELMFRIDQARAVESRLAVAEERLRFARDLHDTLGRNLSAIALKSQVARAHLGRDTDAATDEVDAVRQLADESLSEMRAVVRGYRQTDLGTELAGARALLTSAGIEATVDGPPEGDAALAWVVREAVTNVIRHSKASRCIIELSQDGERSTLRIWNDGARDDTGSGSGIDGLRDRLAETGGTLVVRRPRPGEFELIATTGECT